MKHLLYIFVYIFLTSTAYAYEFDCSKDVRDEAYSAMIGNKETSILKTCFADAMVDFFDDVLLKDIPPLTPKEVEYIDKESAYCLKDGNHELSRCSKFFNSRIWMIHRIYTNIESSKSLIGTAKEFYKLIESEGENHYWNRFFILNMKFDIFDNYRWLVDDGLIEMDEKAGLYPHVLLPGFAERVFYEFN